MKIYLMYFTKGAKVVVTDFTGEQLNRVVWRDHGSKVEITSEEIFTALEQGKTDLFAICIPKSDILGFQKELR